MVGELMFGGYYESPLDNNSAYTPRIEMQNLMGSIYNSFFIPLMEGYPHPIRGRRGPVFRQ